MAAVLPRKGETGRKKLAKRKRPKADALRYAVGLIDQVCQLAGAKNLLPQSAGHRTKEPKFATSADRTAALFNRLLEAFSFQGISDWVALSYLDQHGRVRWSDVDRAIKAGSACPKLRNYWTFHNCGYQKTKRTCAHQGLLAGCPLPSHDMRNGRLNQTAYSLYLFVRDVAEGDLANWIDTQLRAASEDAKGQALVGPFRCLFGVSDKVLNMALSDLLLAGPIAKPEWAHTGRRLIAVDTLVHNFLHRTGILRRFAAAHAYGPACYGPGGCEQLLNHLASQIDARKFSATYPRRFPRFVQHAVWRFCAQQELDICNGNKIDDRKRCGQKSCPMFCECDRVALQDPQADRRPNMRT